MLQARPQVARLRLYLNNVENIQTETTDIIIIIINIRIVSRERQ